jgi:hypothetical protein
VNDNLFADGFFVNGASQAQYEEDTAAYGENHYGDVASGFLAAAQERGIVTKEVSEALAAEEPTDDDKALALERKESFSALAFCMKEQATDKKTSELVKLSQLDYYDWLASFEPMAFDDVGTITDILTLWRGNAEDKHIDAKNR